MERKITLEEVIDFINTLYIDEEVKHAMDLGAALGDDRFSSDVSEEASDIVKAILEKAKWYFNIEE